MPNKITSKIWSSLKKPYGLLLSILLAVTAYSRLRYLFSYSVWPDEANYAWLSKHIFDSTYSSTITRQGAAFTFFITKVLNQMMNNPLIAGKITTILFSLIGVVSVFLIGKDLKNWKVGISAAAIYSFVPTFWAVGVRFLLGPIVSGMSVLTIYFLIKYEKKRKTKWGIYTVISALITSTVQGKGILIVGVVTLYFLVTYRERIISLLKEEKSFQISVGLFIVLLSSLIISNYIIGGTLIGKGVGVIGKGAEASGGRSEWTFFLKQTPSYVSWIGTAFFLGGIGLIGRDIYKKGIEENKFKVLLLTWYGVFLFFFSFLINIPSPRYLLGGIPAIVLITAMCMDRIKIKGKDIVLIVGTIGILYLSISTGFTIVEGKTRSYTGLKEAGDFIEMNYREGQLVYAGSRRAIRLFLGMPYEKQGGNIRSLPDNKSKFEKQIENKTKAVWLEVDTWEYTQPSWVYPLDKNKLGYLTQLGFKPVKVVEKEINTREGLRKTSVVFILRRPRNFTQNTTQNKLSKMPN